MKIEDTLRQVLEALVLGRAMYNPISTTWGTIDDAITSVYKTIENIQPKEPEQEPVAWRVSYPNDPELGFWFAEGIGGEGCLNEPLYTTPPQRRPLTDKQRRTIVAKLSEADYADGDEWDSALIDEVEAAHGIKE